MCISKKRSLFSDTQNVDHWPDAKSHGDLQHNDNKDKWLDKEDYCKAYFLILCLLFFYAICITCIAGNL